MKKSRRLDIIIEDTFEKFKEFGNSSNPEIIKSLKLPEIIESLSSYGFIFPVYIKINSEKKPYYRLTMQGDKVYSILKKYKSKSFSRFLKPIYKFYISLRINQNSL